MATFLLDSSAGDGRSAPTVFADRFDAGRELAERLAFLAGEDVVVLGVPRGGVPVAYAVAEALDAPLDVIVVRKLGVPFRREVPMGAIGEDGSRILDARVIERAHVPAHELRIAEEKERAVLEAGIAGLRSESPRVDLLGKTAVIVDDAIVTGSVARVAAGIARRLGATRVIVAVPVAAKDSIQNFDAADEVVAVATPQVVGSAAEHYRDFSCPSEEGVQVLLASARRRMANNGLNGHPGVAADVEVAIPVGTTTISGTLHVVDSGAALVIFANSNGLGRHSPRNRLCASTLHLAGISTLLVDLLTSDEDVFPANHTDIDLLAGRIVAATAWAVQHSKTAQARIGYLATDNAAGAALRAAGEQGAAISAVVSRGGRPELAGGVLASVTAPTLLVVGSEDTFVLTLNRDVQSHLRCASKLAIVEGASHTFDEPGTLQEAARLSAEWFTRYLIRGNGNHHRGTAWD